MRSTRIVGLLAGIVTAAALSVTAMADVTLYNVSYDATRELYAEVGKAFAETPAGAGVVVKNSHAGSGKQSRAVLDGGKADVVTLALPPEVDVLATKGHLLPENWQGRLPSNSSPYTSTIVFLVRKGNPKGIHEWNDLIKPEVAVIVPDPKSSGAARWAYLAAWGQAAKATQGDEGKAREYVTALYKHVPILDSSGRGATITFAQRGQGDVLLGWENEAYLAKDEFAKEQFEIVTPGVSVLAEPPVAVVDKNAQRDGVQAQAEGFLKFLYTAPAQEIIARHYFRPRDEAVAKKFVQQFPAVQRFTVDEVFGSWTKAQATHFADKGVFDQIYRKNQN